MCVDFPSHGVVARAIEEERPGLGTHDFQALGTIAGVSEDIKVPVESPRSLNPVALCLPVLSASSPSASHPSSDADSAA